MADIRSDVTAGVAEVSAEEELRICLFLMGADTYAIPVEALTEIIIPQKIFPIPTTPAYVAGIINLRGNIIPIVDIRPVLALSQEAASGQIAILRYNQMPIGIVVDNRETDRRGADIETENTLLHGHPLRENTKNDSHLSVANRGAVAFRKQN